MIRTIKQVAKYVYKTLGPGHEEAIYRDAMSVEPRSRIAKPEKVKRLGIKREKGFLYRINDDGDIIRQQIL